ncbi:hypothetical protein BJX64DRAFT_269228 [Aspergillus heterothallicus]
MKFSSIIFAVALHFISTLCQQTLLPFNLDPFPTCCQLDTVMEHRSSCPTNPPDSTTERTEFSRGGCIIYGYPSTGGVLIKDADLVDMLFLSLPRSRTSQRALGADEEDRFCHMLRQSGAILWPSKRDWMRALLGVREMTEEEQKVLVFGWPADGVGVWVLRYASERQMPRDFGKIRLAVSMEERIQIMEEYGATFVEDVMQVEELRGAF